MADRLYAQTPHPYQVNALVALAEARMAQGRMVDALPLASRLQSLLADIESAPDSTRDAAQDVVERLCAAEPVPDGLDCSKA